MRHALLELSLRPGVGALTGVVAVLHARGADVAAMTYGTRSGSASLALQVHARLPEAELLARQLRRRVDVVDVVVSVPPEPRG